jgi:hypothetical protein
MNKNDNGLYGWEMPFLIFTAFYLLWHLMKAFY